MNAVRCAIVISTVLLTGTLSAQNLTINPKSAHSGSTPLAVVQPGSAVPLQLDPFWQTTESGVYSTGLGWGDCDNDGYLDCFISNGNDMHRSSNCIYLSVNGTLPASASWNSANAEYSGHCAVGDLNHDGFPEFIVANYLGMSGFTTGNYSNMYINTTGLPLSTPAWYSADSAYSFSCALGDIDNDGDLDLALATGEEYNGISTPQLVFLNDNGTLQTTPYWQSTTTFEALDVTWGDVDNDGDLDLAVASGNHGATLFRNIGGTLETTPSWNAAFTGPSNTLIFGDVNKDGWLDLIVAYNSQTGGTGQFMVYFNDGTGHYQGTPGWISSTSGYGSALALYDYDHDGDLDLAAGRWWENTMVYENTGTTFTTSPVWLSNTNTVVEELSWVDIDGNGSETYVDSFPADGKRLHYLRHMPIQSLDSVKIDGLNVPLAEFCFDREAGWVSTQSDANSETIVYYTYSTCCDLTESNWDTSNMAFANTNQPILRMFADTNFGWAPLTVQFSDSSLGATSWLWRFGDGDSSTLKNPVHSYTEAGSYDVYLGAFLPDGLHQRNQRSMVTVYADSLQGETVYAAPGTQVEVDLYAVNSLPLRQIIIPVEFDGPLSLSLDSFSTSGCRTDYFQTASFLQYDSWYHRAAINLKTSNVAGSVPDLSPGDGLILKLFLSIPTGAPLGQTNPILIDGYSSYLPLFVADRLSFTPKLLSPAISTGSCCVGIRGNADGSAEDAPDISDVIFLVEYSFAGGAPASCEEEADINADGSVDISDLIYLVDYSFGDGPPPLPCQ